MILSTQSHKATIRLELGSPKITNTIFQALNPEVHSAQKSGARIQIEVEASMLILSFEAQSKSRLRAIINSYLRWIIAIMNTVEIGISEKQVYHSRIVDDFTLTHK